MPEQLSDAERHVLHMLQGPRTPGSSPPGSFHRALIDCFVKATDDNFDRLRRAFKEYGDAVEDWQSGELAEKARQAVYGRATNTEGGQ